MGYLSSLKSTDELPRHGLCPGGPKSWCKYNKAVAENQQASLKYKNSLPEAVREEIKPTFNALSYPSLLRKCIHGKTQNVNESLNNVLWSRIPKSTFVQRRTHEFGVFEAISCFNDRNITKCRRLLQMVGIEPGLRTISTMKIFDETRVLKAEIVIYFIVDIRFTMYRKIGVIISILAIVEGIEIPNKVWESPESGIVMEPET